MADQNDTKSAINWDSKDAAYQAYLELLQQYKSFSFVLKQGKGLRKVYPSFQSALATFRMTVLGQFKKFLESEDYKTAFPKSEITAMHFQSLHNTNIAPDTLLKMTEIILYWAQEEGPFATLTEKLNPRKGWG